MDLSGFLLLLPPLPFLSHCVMMSSANTISLSLSLSFSPLTPTLRLAAISSVAIFAS